MVCFLVISGQRKIKICFNKQVYHKCYQSVVFQNMSHQRSTSYRYPSKILLPAKSHLSLTKLLLSLGMLLRQIKKSWFIGKFFFFFVFCFYSYAGVSRSTSCVIAYLICERKMGYFNALYFVRANRSCACPN